LRPCTRQGGLSHLQRLKILKPYSGEWVLRTPKSLHRGLAERARQEGVSLNALAVAMPAQGPGQRMPRGF